MDCSPESAWVNFCFAFGPDVVQRSPWAVTSQPANFATNNPSVAHASSQQQNQINFAAAAHQIHVNQQPAFPSVPPPRSGADQVTVVQSGSSHANSSQTTANNMHQQHHQMQHHGHQQMVQPESPPTQPQAGTSGAARARAKQKRANKKANEYARDQYLHLFTKIPHCYNCSGCRGQFEDKASLLVHSPCYFVVRGLPDHSVRRSEKLSVELTCGIGGCTKSFSNVYMLRKHVGFHFEEYNFLCNRCGHRTKVRSDMVKHVRSHVEARPYKCYLCPKTFRDSGSLKVHQRVHTGEKPFKCNWTDCPKAFSTSSERSVHLKRVHLLVRDFKCPYDGCEMAYVTNKERMAHLKAAHKGFAPTEEQLLQGFKGKQLTRAKNRVMGLLSDQVMPFYVKDRKNPQANG